MGNQEQWALVLLVTDVHCGLMVHIRRASKETLGRMGYLDSALPISGIFSGTSG